MKKHTDNNKTLGLISLFVNRALNDPNEPDEVKVVLPDECGDTLWDKVLNLEVKACDIKTSKEK
jgi:hypothetical protein